MLNTISDKGNTLLINFVEEKKFNAVNFLVKNSTYYYPDDGVDLNKTNRYNETAMHVAAGSNCLDLLKLLLEHTPNSINLRASHKMTMLHRAARSATPAVIQCLLSYNADPRVVDSDRRTAFHVARTLENLQVLLKVKYAATILTFQCKSDYELGTPLYLACRSYQYKLDERSYPSVDYIRALFYANKEAARLVPNSTERPAVSYLLLEKNLEKKPDLAQLIAEMLPYLLPSYCLPFTIPVKNVQFIIKKVITQNQIELFRQILTQFSKSMIDFFQESDVIDFIKEIAMKGAVQNPQQKHNCLEMIFILMSTCRFQLASFQAEKTFIEFLNHLDLTTTPSLFWNKSASIPKFLAAQAAYQAAYVITSTFFEDIPSMHHEELEQKEDGGFQKEKADIIAALIEPLQSVPFSQNAFALNCLARQITDTKNQEQMVVLISTFYGITVDKPELSECNRVLSQALSTVEPQYHSEPEEEEERVGRVEVEKVIDSSTLGEEITIESELSLPKPQNSINW